MINMNSCWLQEGPREPGRAKSWGTSERMIGGFGRGDSHRSSNLTRLSFWVISPQRCEGRQALSSFLPESHWHSPPSVGRHVVGTSEPLRWEALAREQKVVEDTGRLASWLIEQEVGWGRVLNISPKVPRHSLGLGRCNRSSSSSESSAGGLPRETKPCDGWSVAQTAVAHCLGSNPSLDSYFIFSGLLSSPTKWK